MNKFWRILFLPFMGLFRNEVHDRQYTARLAPWRHHLVWAFLLLSSLTACGARTDGPAPVYNAAVENHNLNLGAHMVESGDTPQKIAANYGLSIDDILQANGLSDASQVSAGQRLYLPDSSKYNLASIGRVQSFMQKAEQDDNNDNNNQLAMMDTLESTPAQSVVKSEALAPLNGNEVPQQTLTTASAQPAPQTVTPAAPAPEPVKVASALPPEQWSNPLTSGFKWPVKGPTLSSFGEKPDGSRNDGINIGALEGSAVEAAADGEIVYTGQVVDGFGNLILMKHKDNFVTAYGHLSRMDVQKGQTVHAGDIIGGVGKTGSVKASQLHFEIRHGGKILNPSDYLKKGVTSTMQTASVN